jgi:hypothetical protein
VIPPSIRHCTAIGRIFARVFFIHIIADYDQQCVDDCSFARLHIIIHNNNPTFVEEAEMQSLPTWNSETHEKLIFSAMPPFIYAPTPQIPYLNMEPPQPQFAPNEISQQPLFSANEHKDDHKCITK